MSLFPDTPTSTSPKPTWADQPGIYLGPLIFGVSFDVIFFGFALNQMNQYFSRRAHKDTRLNKVIASWTMGVGAATTCFGIWYAWEGFVMNFGQWDHVWIGSLSSLVWYGFLNVLLVFPIQVFYLQKVYRTYDRSLLVLAISIPLIVGSAIGGTGFTIIARTAKSEADLERSDVWYWIWLSLSFGFNTLITTSTFLNLYRTSSWGLKRDPLVYRLTRIILETMATPLLLSLGSVISHGLSPPRPLDFFWLMQSKIYLISMLGLMNSITLLRASIPLHGSDEVIQIRTFPLDEHTLKTTRFDVKSAGSDEIYIPGVGASTSTVQMGDNDEKPSTVAPDEEGAVRVRCVIDPVDRTQARSMP